jgi:mono/diheme cytochrome c family protein
MAKTRHEIDRRRRLLGSLAVALLASACHRERTPVERGASAFQRACSGCHGPDGRGTRPPGFKTAPRNLTDPELQSRLTDAMLKETIRFGKGQMPNFGAALPERDIDDIIAYVRTLRALPR